VAGCLTFFPATTRHSTGMSAIPSHGRPSPARSTALVANLCFRWGRHMRRPAIGVPGPFTVTRDGGSGLTRAQARGATYVQPSRGVRVNRWSDDDVLRRAAAMGSGPDAVLTDLSAARLLGLPLPPRFGLAPEDAISVARPAGQPRPDRAGVRGRRLRLPAEHLTTLDGTVVTTPGRTWLDCAASIPLAHVVAMGDHILHHGLAPRSELDELVRWARRRRGVVTARRALPLLDSGAESAPESLVRVYLVLSGMPRPECNLNIWQQDCWLARVDLAWPEARLVVEYDGTVHLEDAQRRRDATRRNDLQDAGWLVITLTADSLRDPERMCQQVRRAYLSRVAAR
jgi:Protein of unknown function (DUF559)